MKINKKATIVLAIFIVHFPFNCICQTKQPVYDFLIACEKINFHLNDSIYPFTLLIPQLEHEFSSYRYYQGHSDITDLNTNSAMIFGGFKLIKKERSRKNKKERCVYKEKFILKSDSVLDIYSYFPDLIKNDSSIINNYEFEWKPMPKIFELEYSFILNKHKEPLIYKRNSNSLRIIYKSEKSENSTIVFRLDLDKPHKIVYTEGTFDSTFNYTITKKDSAIIKDKDFENCEKILKKIDFNKEYYFVEVGGNIFDRYFIEYKTADKYYALERQTIALRKKDRQFSDIYDYFWGLQCNYLRATISK